jgi:N-acetyl sugar amidotransferase
MGKGSCTRCLFDDTVKNITFDREGVCNFCRLHEKLAKKPDKSEADKMLAHIKRRRRNKEYDCIVPFSGGVDSSYALYCVKKAGLRPIAVHSDNGWVTELSRRNMEKVVDKLGVPFVRLAKDWDIMRDAYLAFLKASVPGVCSACEVKNISEILEFADSKGIPYIFFGFSPRTEGISPLSWHYIDGRYFNGIVKRFAENKTSALSLNRLGLFDLFCFLVLKRIKLIQLPSLVEWDEEKIKEILKREFDWEDGGHHSDCYYYPAVKWIAKKKFNIDRAKTFYCAMINSGMITREEALERSKAPNDKNEVDMAVEYATGKLGINKEEFNDLASRPAKYFTDYPTYYPFLKAVKPLVWLACRSHMLLSTFYYKLFRAG